MVCVWKLVLVALLYCFPSAYSDTCTLSCDCDPGKNCTITCDDSKYLTAVGFAVFFPTILVGILIGIGASIAVCKFVIWMKDKSVIFTPWPRIRPNDPTGDVPDSIVHNPDGTLHNPTYEIESCPTPVQIKPTKKLPVPSSHNEVYEAIQEEPEQQFEFDDTAAIPYAIHDFEESARTANNTAVVASLNDAGRRVSSPKKKRKVKGKDFRRSWSESSKGTASVTSRKPIVKPPIAARKTALVRPPLKSDAQLVAHSTSLQPDVPPHGGAYSELDKKASYATLEAHTGECEEKEIPLKESYHHLNH